MTESNTSTFIFELPTMFADPFAGVLLSGFGAGDLAWHQKS
ncbi:hypothetical protein FB384_005239 [Prauserella sediminis]|uniref:Uncharacterized protein n=1 Tax=Prauserella sediminis TaxID=577680 RepID=A0A839XYU0_9PSEU|nr:hypothetical protein [Prauserella sediminis]MBB3666278.1 hypothetical protein [Prauserella sediminis]